MPAAAPPGPPPTIRKRQLIVWLLKKNKTEFFKLSGKHFDLLLLSLFQEFQFEGEKASTFILLRTRF
jgi:hypothetical protein